MFVVVVTPTSCYDNALPTWLGKCWLGDWLFFLCVSSFGRFRLIISFRAIKKSHILNPLSASPTKWSNTLKQFVAICRRIVWVCLTILWNWHQLLFRFIDFYFSVYLATDLFKNIWPLLSTRHKKIKTKLALRKVPHKMNEWMNESCNCVLHVYNFDTIFSILPTFS